MKNIPASSFLIVTTGISAALLITLGVLLNIEKAWSDDDSKNWHLYGLTTLNKSGVMPVKNAAYKEECGSCHMAYSPGLLSADSWKKMMLNLENHFGDNAELKPKTGKEILSYLIENAADQSEYRRSKKIMRSLAQNRIVDRITQTPYFIRKHDEIPERYITENEKVVSLSNCGSCHQNAEKGSFDEDDVSIPGVGYWED
jgi:Dihaem cytochrome c